MKRFFFFLTLFILPTPVFAQELIPSIDQAYGDYQSYRWNCHSHTADSDGKFDVESVVRSNLGTTAQILALTDHGEHLSQAQWLAQGQIDRTRWDVLRGFELTGTWVDNATKVFQPYRTPGWGHLLIYRTEVFTATKILGNGEPPSLQEAYQDALDWIERRPEALVVFAHPSLYRVETSFDGFASPTSKKLIKQFFGCELSAHSFPETYVGLGEIKQGLRASNEACFRELLRKGWQIAPVMGGDQHGPRLGNVSTLTGLWLKKPLKSAIYEAMEKRRCFATEDPNAVIKFLAWCRENQAVMGESLEIIGDSFFLSCKVDGVSASSITFVGLSSDGSDYDFEIVSQNLEASRSFFGDDLCCNLIKNKQIVCIYAKARLVNGKDIISAPIWLKGVI